MHYDRDCPSALNNPCVLRSDLSRVVAQGKSQGSSDSFAWCIAAGNADKIVVVEGVSRPLFHPLFLKTSCELMTVDNDSNVCLRPGVLLSDATEN